MRRRPSSRRVRRRTGRAPIGAQRMRNDCGRDEAERLMAALEREVAAARERIRRGSIADEELETITARVSERVSALEAIAPARLTAGDGVAAWKVGMRARTRDGWDGRVTALDRGGRRATLEAGMVRVLVPVEDLLPAGAGAGAQPPAVGSATRDREAVGGLARRTPRAGRKGEFGALPAGRRGRNVPGSAVRLTLDVRGARVDEALELLDSYLDRASLGDAEQVTVVHASGTEALRDAVRGHP